MQVRRDWVRGTGELSVLSLHISGKLTLFPKKRVLRKKYIYKIVGTV